MTLGAGAIALTIATAFGWSILDLLRRRLADRLDALSLVAWVTIGASAPLLVWYLLDPGSKASPGYAVPAIASVAVNLVANLLYFRALQLAPLSQTLPMLSLTPAFAATLGALFLGERMGVRGVAGLVSVVVGALLLVRREPASDSSGSGTEDGRGARWMIVVAFLWSVTLLLDKRAVIEGSAQLHALVLNAGVAAGALAILAGRRELGRLAALRGHVPLWIVATLVSAVALGAQLLALHVVPLGFLETVKRGIGGVLAVVWGRAFYGEPSSPRKLVAVALLSLGVALLVL